VAGEGQAESFHGGGIVRQMKVDLKWGIWVLLLDELVGIDNIREMEWNLMEGLYYEEVETMTIKNRLEVEWP